MQKIIPTLALTLLLPLCALAQEQPAKQAGNAQKAQEVLQQARAALGGEASLKAIQILSVSGEYHTSQGQRQVSGEIKFDLLLPDKYLKTLTISSQMGSLKTLEAVNGADAWVDRKMISSPGGGG